MAIPTVAEVKTNLIISTNTDDAFIGTLINVAVSYVEARQHKEDGWYTTHAMTDRTKQAVILLTSHFYESRDGATGGFFADTTGAADQTLKVVDTLLLLDKDWVV